MNKTKKVTTYDGLKNKIVSAIETKGRAVGDFIPPKTGVYWLIGKELVWNSEAWLKRLASDLRIEHKKSWNEKDLIKMFQLYLRHPTIEKLSGRCVGRKSMTLDELLDTGK